MPANWPSDDIYPEDGARWAKSAEEYQAHLSIRLVDRIPKYYCGYVRFRTKPLRSEGEDEFSTYVPVHGGITYAEEDAEGFIYGFDCDHCDDHERPETKDIEWVKAECWKLLYSILEAPAFEDQYLAVPDDDDADDEVRMKAREHERAAAIDSYHQHLREKGIADFHLADSGFNSMLNALFGKL